MGWYTYYMGAMLLQDDGNPEAYDVGDMEEECGPSNFDMQLGNNNLYLRTLYHFFGFVQSGKPVTTVMPERRRQGCEKLIPSGTSYMPGSFIHDHLHYLQIFLPYHIIQRCKLRLLR